MGNKTSKADYYPPSWVPLWILLHI
jgi:hypothetical protein